MDRRRFLKLLGCGTALAVVGKVVVDTPEPISGEVTVDNSNSRLMWSGLRTDDPQWDVIEPWGPSKADLDLQSHQMYTQEMVDRFYAMDPTKTPLMRITARDSKDAEHARLMEKLLNSQPECERIVKQAMLKV